MIIPDARTASDMTNASIMNDTNVSLNKTILDAINTSIGNKSKTATVSFSGKSGMDVMNGLQELRRKGFNVTQSGTNLTINW